MSRTNKLQRFEELKTFSNVIQPQLDEVYGKGYKFKGRWSELFFKNNNPIILELACGKGEYSLGLAKTNPGVNYLGMDIKGARIWKGAKTALQEHINNVAFIRSRIEFVDSFFEQNEISETWIPFPDPQARKSKENKRLTSPRFIEKYRKFVRTDGIVHLKTDDYNLYAFTLEVIKTCKCQLGFFTDDLYHKPILNLNEEQMKQLYICTFYEKMHLAEGKKIYYLNFKL